MNENVISLDIFQAAKVFAPQKAESFSSSITGILSILMARMPTSNIVTLF